MGDEVRYAHSSGAPVGANERVYDAGDVNDNDADKKTLRRESDLSTQLEPMPSGHVHVYEQMMEGTGNEPEYMPAD